MSKMIRESGVDFGPFPEEKVFYIEKSHLYQSLGSGLKSVEFIFTTEACKMLCFLEAKTTCPNGEHRFDNDEKKQSYEEFYSDVVQKMEDSIRITVAALLGRYKDTEGIGSDILKHCAVDSVRLKFVLVITSVQVKDTWLPGPKAELERRLLSLRKTWGVDIIVMNRRMAAERKLICE